jgi:flagellar biosynthesis anti-sigma factor FlgM
MSIDKLSSNAAITSAPERSPRSAVINGEQKAASSKAAAAQKPVSTADVVRISVTAKGMLQAVKSSADDEEFDQARVDSIRREIAEGRFPIDEDRLAQKFRELEEQLGDFG